MEANSEVQGIVKDTQAYIKSKIGALASADAPTGLIQNFSNFCSSLEDADLLFKMLEKLDNAKFKEPKDILEFLERMRQRNKN